MGHSLALDNPNRIWEQTSQWLAQHHSDFLISASANIWRSQSEPTTLKFYGHFWYLLASVTVKTMFQLINSDYTSKEWMIVHGFIYSSI